MRKRLQGSSESPAALTRNQRKKGLRREGVRREKDKTRETGWG